MTSTEHKQETIPATRHVTQEPCLASTIDAVEKRGVDRDVRDVVPRQTKGVIKCNHADAFLLIAQHVSLVSRIGVSACLY